MAAAKRIGKDPKQIKAVFQECWSLGKTQNAFAHALKERGYILARGDRRGFVAVDHKGECLLCPNGLNSKQRKRAPVLPEKKSAIGR